MVGSPEAWIALVSLIALEIALGTDNIVCIAILLGNIPKQQRERARRLNRSDYCDRRGRLLSLPRYRHIACTHDLDSRQIHCAGFLG